MAGLALLAAFARAVSRAALIQAGTCAVQQPCAEGRRQDRAQERRIQAAVLIIVLCLKRLADR
jgi:hypothetical protein